MDPNNNQPINNEPVLQAAPAPVKSVPTPITEPVIPTPIPQAPKSGGKKVITLLVILIILALGIGSYVLFVKNQLSNQQKVSTENTSVIIPSPTITPTPTPATVDEINVASPDADLNEIEKDLQGL